MAAVDSNVCQFYKFGYCRFRDTCRKQHIQETCEDIECDLNACNKRHPLTCKYFIEFQRCKFGEYCCFKHEKVTIRNNEENDKLKKKIEQLETAITSLGMLYSDLKKKFEEIDANESSDTDVEAEVVSLSGDVKELMDKTDIHQLKLDVFNEEFFAYSKIVDDLQSKVFNIEKNFEQFHHRGFSQAAYNVTTPAATPPTPPFSSRKKTRP